MEPKETVGTALKLFVASRETCSSHKTAEVEITAGAGRPLEIACNAAVSIQLHDQRSRSLNLVRDKAARKDTSLQVKLDSPTVRGRK